MLGDQFKVLRNWQTAVDIHEQCSLAMRICILFNIYYFRDIFWVSQINIKKKRNLGVYLFRKVELYKYTREEK